MTHAEPDPTAGPSPVEGTSISVLPARDIPETLALFEQFGFTVRHDEDNEYAIRSPGHDRAALHCEPEPRPVERCRDRLRAPQRRLRAV